MKRLDEKLCFTVAIATISRYLIEYLWGRLNSIELTLVQIVPMLLSVVCLVSLSVLLVKSLANRRPAGKTVSLLALSFFFFSCLTMCFPERHYSWACAKELSRRFLPTNCER
jgi:hypothetical protein